MCWKCEDAVKAIREAERSGASFERVEKTGALPVYHWLTDIDVSKSGFGTVGDAARDFLKSKVK